MSRCKSCLYLGCLMVFGAAHAMGADRKGPAPSPAATPAKAETGASRIEPKVRTFVTDGIVKRYPALRVVDLELTSQFTAGGGAGELTRYIIKVVLETTRSATADALPHCFQPIMAPIASSVFLAIGTRAEAFVVVDKDTVGNNKQTLRFSGYWIQASN
ncbi:MAG TPA: hypothetical protein VK188_05825 [Holophaga sp.]|nr:hypothetical protein [Holophaga sp.]